MFIKLLILIIIIQQISSTFNINKNYLFKLNYKTLIINDGTYQLNTKLLENQHSLIINSFKLIYIRNTIVNNDEANEDDDYDYTIKANLLKTEFSSQYFIKLLNINENLINKSIAFKITFDNKYLINNSYYYIYDIYYNDDENVSNQFRFYSDAILTLNSSLELKWLNEKDTKLDLTGLIDPLNDYTINCINCFDLFTLIVNGNFIEINKNINKINEIINLIIDIKQNNDEFSLNIRVYPNEYMFESDEYDKESSRTKRIETRSVFNYGKLTNVNMLKPFQMVINENKLGLYTSEKIYDHQFIEYQLNASDYVKERIQIITPENLINITKRFDYELAGPIHHFQVIFFRKSNNRIGKIIFLLNSYIH